MMLLYLLMLLSTHGCCSLQCYGQVRLQDGGLHVDLRELRAARKLPNSYVQNSAAA